MSEREDEPSEPPRNGHDLDEKVKIPLPFEDALRGLLATEPPDENGKGEKQSAEKQRKH